MTWTHPAYEAVVNGLGARTGLTFSQERHAHAEIGVRRAMGRAGTSDPERYRQLLAKDESLLDDLIVELTVGETYFFREPAQFEFIRRVVLPGLRLDRGRAHPGQIWSAACASGEEAYSLAMLIEEEKLAGQVHVLATDISRAALSKARLGDYGPWSLRGEGEAIARRHLRREGNRIVVGESIRKSISFEYLNLALDVYPSFVTGTWGLDLVLCRNVLIYFDRDTVRAVAQRLYSSLAEGGWLITASSDPPLGDAAPFEVVVADEGVFYRRASLADPLQVQSRGLVIAGLEPKRPARPVPPPLPIPSRESVLDEARQDLAAGRYAEAADRTRGLEKDVEAAALYVRALANLDAAKAESACAEAVRRHSFSSELHYLRAVLLVGLGRDEEAAAEARRVLYLDRSLAIAHCLLGALQRRRGDHDGAWRSFRNARDLCSARPVDEVVPLSDGEPNGRLAENARLQMAQIELSREDHG